MVKNKHGFTLVELSIVLVIIGLLIGGILVAQSMVKTAKVQATIKQLSQFDVANTNFTTKYGQLAGDDTLFPRQVWNSSDGILDDGYKVSSFWNHLSLGVGLKTDVGTDYLIPDPYSTPITHLYQPMFPLDQDTTNSVGLSVAGYLGGFMSGPGNSYLYQGKVGRILFNAGVNPGPLLPADVAAIDLKLDDGLPMSGNVSANGTGCTIQNAATGWVVKYKGLA